MAKRLAFALAVLLMAGVVEAAISRYGYRVLASATPGARQPQLIIADTEAECPSADVGDGDICYGKDTDVLRIRAAGAWATLSTGGGGLSDGDKGDITVSASGTTFTIDGGVVAFAKMQDIATDRLVGRDTAATGDPEEITVSGGLEWTGSGGIQRSALTGDVTATAGSNTTVVADDSHAHTAGTISALDAGDTTTGAFADARVDGSLEVDEVVLAGDVDGAANANDLDEAAVETELEGVLDLADLQGAVPLAKLADDAASGLCLVSGGAGGDPNYATCPGGGGGLSHAQVLSRASLTF